MTKTKKVLNDAHFFGEPFVLPPGHRFLGIQLAMPWVEDEIVLAEIEGEIEDETDKHQCVCRPPQGYRHKCVCRRRQSEPTWLDSDDLPFPPSTRGMELDAMEEEEAFSRRLRRLRNGGFGGLPN